MFRQYTLAQTFEQYVDQPRSGNLAFYAESEHLCSSASKMPQHSKGVQGCIFNADQVTSWMWSATLLQPCVQRTLRQL